MNKMFIKIESELKAQNKTKVWFSEAMGESTQNITNWKNRGVPLTKVAKIAEVLGLSRGYLEGSEPRVTQTRNSNVVNIQHLSAVAGMGALISIDADHDSQITTVQLTKQYLSSHLGSITKPSNLKLMAGLGDSMKGVFNSGDTLFVDTGVNTFVTESTYVIHFDDSIWVKRLARNGRGGFKIISSNKEYDPVIVEKGDASFKIIGLVVGVLNINKLV